jgi:hypothetical protein
MCISFNGALGVNTFGAQQHNKKKNNDASTRTSISLEQVAYAILVLGNPKGQRVPITISKFFIERLWYESLRAAHWYLFVSLFLPHFCFPLFPLV